MRDGTPVVIRKTIRGLPKGLKLITTKRYLFRNLEPFGAVLVNAEDPRFLGPLLIDAHLDTLLRGIPVYTSNRRIEWKRIA